MLEDMLWACVSKNQGGVPTIFGVCIKLFKTFDDWIFSIHIDVWFQVEISYNRRARK